MGDDLLSIVFSSSSCNSLSSSPSSSSSSIIAWKNHYHSIVFSSSHLSPYTMNNLPPPAEDHCHDGDTCLQSTGYLEDVLSEYVICSTKRRRLLEFEMDTSSFLQEWWTPSLSSNDLTEECCSYGTKNHDDISSMDNLEDSIKRITPEEEEEEEEEEEVGISETTTLLVQEDSSSSPQKDHSNKTNLHCIDPIINSSGVDDDGGEKTKKRAVATVAYPFAVVKPGGREGDVTLKDINERILMPPTRPVRHPVGAYACQPMISPDGPGLSGKAVVAFTRIHMQGRRGTITIIRTRG